MPDWNEILNEIQLESKVSTFDSVRRKYLKILSDITGRNIIAYYSGWLQKPNASGSEVNDADKNGFMNVIHGLDRTKGLDLILHTQGGNTAATESLVDYLHSMFGHNIRAFVPQLAMSAGTMIACACDSIYMGKHSSLGPVDPQIGGISAHAIVEEFTRAYTECAADKNKAIVWQPIINKYNLTLIGECEKSIAWSERMLKQWLSNIMFRDNPDKDQIIERIWNELGSHAMTLSHSRHLSFDKCREIGLNVKPLEEDKPLQDGVLSVHHAFIHTLYGTSTYKIIENQLGKAFVLITQTVMVPAGNVKSV